MAYSFPDSYKRIKSYAKTFADRLGNKTGGKGLGKPTTKEDNFAVLMERGDVARLLMHPKCYKLAAIIGIADDGTGDQITVSLLAVGADDKVLAEHRGGSKQDSEAPTLPGEEVWPKKVTIADLDTFLP